MGGCGDGHQGSILTRGDSDSDSRLDSKDWTKDPGLVKMGRASRAPSYKVYGY